MPAETARHVLGQVRLADLVTVDPRTLAPAATPMPLVYLPEVGDYGAFHGHLARTNSQWRHADHPALVLVRGGDAYVNPDWYPSYREGGDAVPTWNYEVVQAAARLVVHDDVVWIERHVRELSARFDPGYDLDRSDRRLLEGMFRAVVGIELVVTEVSGKSKLSQNRSSADIDGVVTALTADGRGDLAERMRVVSLPHATAREQVVATARAQRPGTSSPSRASTALRKAGESSVDRA